MHHVWHRLKSFVLRAGKVIMIVVVVLNILNSMGTDGSWNNQDSGDSVLSALGRKITPVLKPMGIRGENWPAAVGLFTGVFAKEAVVGTLDSLYAQMEKKQSDIDGRAEEKEPFNFWAGVKGACLAIHEGFKDFWSSVAAPLGILGAHDEAGSFHSCMIRQFGSKASAFSYLLFILIYAPCVAVMAAIYREIGLKWMLFSVGYLTVLAWLVATAFYQLATFFDHPGSSFGWLVFVCVVLLITYTVLKWKSRNMEVAS